MEYHNYIWNGLDLQSFNTDAGIDNCINCTSVFFALIGIYSMHNTSEDF